MSRADEFSAPILEIIKRLGKATRDQLLDDSGHGIKKQQVDNAIKTLVRRGAIQNISATPRPAIYTADMTVKTSPRAKQVRKLKSDDPVPEKYVGIIAPGTMINKMAGVYVPTRTQPMRHGAMDHEACMSRRANDLVPYSGQYIATGVTEK